MKKFARVLLWVVSNVSLALLIWVGGFGGMEWAGNVARFWAWWTFALALMLAVLAVVFFVATAITEGYDGDPIPDRVIPLPLDLTVDIGLAMAMAAAGWFWTAGAFAAGNMISAMSVGVMRIADRETRPKAEPEPEAVQC